MVSVPPPPPAGRSPDPRDRAAGPAEPLGSVLLRETVVLDGGLSGQLQDLGCDLSGWLWSARLLADDPGAVRAAHAAYAAAGARVLTTAGYQASYQGFARRGMTRAQTTALLHRSVALARQAAGDRAGVWVAASIGPYGAVLADGSEYRGRYGLTRAELERFHRPRIEASAEAGPDVLAFETVPDVDEAEALLGAAAGTGVPVWLSYTVEGGRTRAGQPLEQAFALAAGRPQVIAVGVNCCDPREAEDAVRCAREVTGKPVVVYPNSGERWDAAARAWRGPAAFDAASARRWQAAGARLIGGCCRVGPDRIAALAAALGRPR